MVGMSSIAFFNFLFTFALIELKFIGTSVVRVRFVSFSFWSAVSVSVKLGVFRVCVCACVCLCCRPSFPGLFRSGLFGCTVCVHVCVLPTFLSRVVPEWIVWLHHVQMVCMCVFVHVLVVLPTRFGSVIEGPLGRATPPPFYF